MLPALPNLHHAAKRAFSLLELLVSFALLAIVTVVSYSIVNAVSQAWSQHKARLSTFEKARAGFELLTDRLAQATLNTYWDYNDPARPTRYLRQSELHFLMGRAETLLPDLANVSTDTVFFVAPLGFTQNAAMQPLVKMLTACGFYVRFSEETERPTFLDSRIPKRWRYRLFQFLQPGENLAIYTEPPTSNAWFQAHINAHSYPMIDNVIGLVLRARYPTSSGEKIAYDYDSRSGTASAPPPEFHQLPPVISAAMIVIDEESAKRLEAIHGETPPPVLPEADSFQEPEKFEEDLGKWEDKLRDLKPRVNYRILTADISIRGAKWSSD